MLYIYQYQLVFSCSRRCIILISVLNYCCSDRNIFRHISALLYLFWYLDKIENVLEEPQSQSILPFLIGPRGRSICQKLIQIKQITMSTVWSGVLFCQYSVSSNNSISRQSKTLIRLRALWCACLSASSLAAYATRHISACCCFILSSYMWTSLCHMRKVEIMSYANSRDRDHPAH